MRHSTTSVLLGVLTALFLMAAAASAENGEMLLNGGAEEGMGDEPSAWFAAQVPAEGLRMWRAMDAAHGGQASLAISNTHAYKEPVSNNWAQEIADVPVGQALVLRAWVRIQGAEAANVCVQCWDLDRKSMLAFETTPVLRGDREWTNLASAPLVVPEGTASIMVRAALTGKGAAWFDDISLAPSQMRSIPGQSITPMEAGAIPPDLAKAAGGEIVASTPVTRDAMVLAYLPDWAHGNVDNIAVANNDGGVRTLVEWPLNVPGMDLGRELYLALYARKVTEGPTPGKLQVYRVIQAWPDGTSWKKQPAYAKEPLTEVDFAPGEGWKLFNVTPKSGGIAGVWAGMMLRFADETKSGNERNWSGYAFVSSEAAGEWADKRPRVIVVKPMPGQLAGAEAAKQRETP